MRTLPQPFTRAVTTISISLLVGCATGSKDTLLPQGGPTMREVYDAHFEKTRQRRTEGARRERGARGAGDAALNLDGWTRGAHTEIQHLFPRLPNPDLVLYVFPHISPQGHPVPGYATSFPMYETVEYALPGEAEGW